MDIICRYEYCIYQKNGACLLNGAVINETGVCSACVRVYVESLEEDKQNHIRELYGCTPQRTGPKEQTNVINLRSLK